MTRLIIAAVAMLTLLATACGTSSSGARATTARATYSTSGQELATSLGGTWRPAPADPSDASWGVQPFTDGTITLPDGFAFTFESWANVGDQTAAKALVHGFAGMMPAGSFMYMAEGPGWWAFDEGSTKEAAQRAAELLGGTVISIKATS